MKLSRGTLVAMNGTALLLALLLFWPVIQMLIGSFTSDQTAGRGRRQRAWIAPKGNLAASVLEVLDIAPAVAATIGFAAGLAEEAALEKVSLEVALRNWTPPHDVTFMFSVSSYSRASAALTIAGTPIQSNAAKPTTLIVRLVIVASPMRAAAARRQPRPMPARPRATLS